ncbi:MAG: hypothetical protein HRU06_16275 [Oceanospirillaceae bacterium]|nr:hypothetical protein [Oceanospirillaceae bacterium]
MKQIVLMLLIIGTGITSGMLQASQAVQGTVIAIKSCAAYQSFRKKTNPGNIYTIIGNHYAVKELNKKAHNSRYRIIVAGATPKMRWIDGSCVSVGEIALGKSNGANQQNWGANQGKTQNNRCESEPGLADSNVLALSWQSAFCEIKPDKKECKVRDSNSYQANNFSLHGLWPNRNKCNRKTGYYGYCGAVNTKPKQFCGYPKLALNEATRAQLRINMPSAAQGTCLQRHEWYKHGTCQSLDVNQYYDIAIALQDEFNNSGIATLMAANIGSNVSTAEFFAVFDHAFGQGAHKKLQFKCTGANLIDVYINLPKDITTGDTLKSLVNRANTNFKNGCGKTFRVDAIDD